MIAAVWHRLTRCGWASAASAWQIGGILLFGEYVSARRFACLALIIAGVVGLKLTE